VAREPVKTVVRRKWTRRDALTVAPVVAAGLGVAAVALNHNRAPVVEQRKGVCRFCLMHCGVVATLHDGRIEKVEGDLQSKTRGFICEHGFALKELVHSGERLRHPLVRRGDTFHEVSWEEALAEIGTRLGAIKARHGAPALAIQTGWPMVRHPLVGFLHRFARAFGSPNVATVASLCESTVRMGQSLTVGTKYAADVRGAKTLVVWGGNPGVTSPPMLHLIADKARTGNLVVIDPVKTHLARSATLHVSIRPGTDGVLALGLIRALEEGGHVDRDALAAQSRGLEELLALCVPYSAERVAELTSVPPETLRRLAGLVAERPVAIWQGLGVEHHENGVQTTRAISSLEVLCGRFDGSHEAKSELTRPSSAVGVLPSLPRMHTPTPAPDEGQATPLGGDRFPLYEAWNREAQAAVFPEAMERGALKALVLWASNPLVTSPGTARLEKALGQLELLVAVDPFLTASARVADVVRPAGTFAESADEEVEPLVSPQGQARTDWAILRGLANACGVGSYFPWGSLKEALAAPQTEWLRDARVQPVFEGLTETPRFGTVSGKVEFASVLLERAGHEPLPKWTAPSRGPDAEFPLWLVSGPRPRSRINSQFSQSPTVMSRMREPEALIHPQVAAKVKIVDGARVAVVSPLGRIALRARVTDEVHPECVVVPSGWERANCNRLIDSNRTDPVSGFPAFRSGTCRVEPDGAGSGS
jgi:anaerobic selenocysteine-containing dehydrogenase